MHIWQLITEGILVSPFKTERHKNTDDRDHKPDYKASEGLG